MNSTLGSLLVVDDNPINLDILGLSLQRKGYSVQTAEGGFAALDAVEQHNFDLILLDLMMEDLAGLDVLKIIRKKHSVTELPVIIVSANDRSEQIVETLNLGANDYVTKPVDIDVALARIRTHLSLKRAEEKLREALEKEKELGELKSRFVSMTSHEFRTPLTAILSASDLLKRYNHKMTEEQRLQRLDKIQAEVKHMTHLLEEVLCVGRAAAGTMALSPETVDLEAFCREIIEGIETIAPKITIVFCAEGHNVYDGMDRKALKHILTNLLSNAVKYSPEGSTVHFDLFGKNKEEAVFKVKDEGIGIPEEDQKRLFEPFHRAKNVGNIQGTGLGLAIIKQSVELHGGAITCESEVGKGTTFTAAVRNIPSTANLLD